MGCQLANCAWVIGVLVALAPALGCSDQASGGPIVVTVKLKAVSEDSVALELGAASVVFPPGSVNADTVVTASASEPTGNFLFELIDGKIYDLGPQGSAFETGKEPVLSIERSSSPPWGAVSTISLITKEGYQDLESVTQGTRVTAKLRHFSRYVLRSVRALSAAVPALPVLPAAAFPPKRTTTPPVIEPAPIAVSRDLTCSTLGSSSALKCWGNTGPGFDKFEKPEQPKPRRAPKYSVGAVGAVGASWATANVGNELAVLQVATAATQVCVLLSDARVKCWGKAGPQLGQEAFEDVGTEWSERGRNLPFVNLGQGVLVRDIALGNEHGCAISQQGTVKCWGKNQEGQLGIGSSFAAWGDTRHSMGDVLPVVPLAKRAKQLALGGRHSCALLENGEIQCWGANELGQLGLGDSHNRGGQAADMSQLPGIDLGSLAWGARLKAKALSAGEAHTCALLTDGQVKCWGSGAWGQLGLDRLGDMGDEPGEMGNALPALQLPDTCVALAAGKTHTCAILTSGPVVCWGNGELGQLGQGDRLARGTGEPRQRLSNVQPVDLGNHRALRLFSHPSADHTCALLEDKSLRCWGNNSAGQLGFAERTPRGDEPGELGEYLPALDSGSPPAKTKKRRAKTKH